MSTADRTLAAADVTFAPIDALALLAYVVDMRGASGAEIAALAVDLGLATSVPFDPERHADTGGLPGDVLTDYGADLVATLTIGRERLAARFPVKAN